MNTTRLASLFLHLLALPVALTLPGCIADAGDVTDDDGALSEEAGAQNKSDLWGQSGEKWGPQSRLPDFSFAGYHSSEKSIPNVPVKANVKSFGAKGDGVHDDTQAFKNAIAQTSGGAILVPKGHYKISDILEIEKSNLVLRGEGQGSTVLHLTKSYKQLTGAVPYSDGLIRVVGKKNGSKIANVTASAKRGETKLTLSSASSINPGAKIRLRMRNPSSNTLGCYLYANKGCLNKDRQGWYAGNDVDWVAEVKSKSGNTITLERPLRLDVRGEWSPEVWSLSATVKEVGIEEMSVEFPNVQYSGHHHEAGYYAFAFYGAFDSWIRNVTIVDADNGLDVKSGGFNTFSGVTLKTKYRTGASTNGETGHYGFAMGGITQDNLVTGAKIDTKFVHNLAVSSFSSGNVYSKITTKHAIFDHHAGAPYENLYTEIVVTENAGNMFQSGGNRPDEPNAGRNETFWNIRALKGGFPGAISSKFPSVNVIGIDKWATKKNDPTIWIEKWPGESTFPPNLFVAQVQRRLGGGVTPPPPPPSGDGHTIALEAESGVETSPMKVASDGNASGGKYVGIPEGAGNSYGSPGGPGSAKLGVSVTEAGTYDIWARTIAPNGTSDSFFVVVDGDLEKAPWHVASSTTWQWHKVTRLSLSEGTHEIHFNAREDGTKLDRIIVTDDLSFEPSGASGNIPN